MKKSLRTFSEKTLFEMSAANSVICIVNGPRICGFSTHNFVIFYAASTWIIYLHFHFFSFTSDKLRKGRLLSFPIQLSKETRESDVLFKSDCFYYASKIPRCFIPCHRNKEDSHLLRIWQTWVTKNARQMPTDRPTFCEKIKKNINCSLKTTIFICYRKENVFILTGIV